MSTYITAKVSPVLKCFSNVLEVRTGFHDLIKQCKVRITIGYVVYSIRTGVSLNRGNYIKGNHLLSKHAFTEIVNTTKVHLFIGGLKTCFKVYIVECVALTCTCQSLNKI